MSSSITNDVREIVKRTFVVALVKEIKTFSQMSQIEKVAEAILEMLGTDKTMDMIDELEELKTYLISKELNNIKEGCPNKIDRYDGYYRYDACSLKPIGREDECCVCIDCKKYIK
ncbi:MAG: hypothetical protein ACRDD7_06865 [Peptostreptococcaceae bacterium]